MSAPTSKQLDRASAIKTFCEQLRNGLNGDGTVAFNESQDGITLTGADFSNTALAYTSGAAMDLVVAAFPQLAALVNGTVIAGTNPPVTISQAIDAVCGS